MRRTALPWLVAAGLLALAAVATVVALNATVLGAGGFVRVYLDAVGRGDARAALALPGVDAGDAADDLLARGALPGLDGIRQLSDEAGPDGTREVTMEWRSAGVAGKTTFTVERVGTRFGLFPEWGFAVSPTTAVTVDVVGDLRYQVGSVEADLAGTDSRDGGVREVALLVPGVYAFEHETRFLTAEPVDVVADSPSESPAAIALQVAPNAAFIDAVETEVNGYLDECATQRVLLPTGCPFGFQESNRIQSEPVWSMTKYPTITMTPGDQVATWRVTDAAAIAHIVVDVRSLFDGSLSTTDVDVPFTVSFQVEFAGESSLTIRAIG